LVGFETLDAECFEAGEEFTDPSVVLDPRLVALDLVGGESSGDGLAGDFAGPLPVRAVRAGWVGLAGAACLAAVGVALLE